MMALFWAIVGVILLQSHLLAQEWSLYVADYYPDEDRIIAEEIDQSLHRFIAAFKSKDVSSMLKEVHRMQKEATQDIYSKAIELSGEEEISNSILEATWLGKDNHFAYIRVLLYAELLQPENPTLETQIYIYGRDKTDGYKWKMVCDFTAYMLSTKQNNLSAIDSFFYNPRPEKE